MAHKPTTSETMAEIKNRVMVGREFTKGWHAGVKQWRDLYEFNHYKKRAKSGESRYIDPTYTNTVDLAVGILQANQKIWKATGWSPSVTGNEGSDSVEKFLAGVIDINADRNEYDLEYEVDLHFARDGGAIIYSVWDPDIEVMNSRIDDVPDFGAGDVAEKKVIDVLPLRVEVVDPLKIHLVPGGPKRWAAVAKVEKMSIHDVEVEYGVKINRHITMEMSEKVKQMGDFIDYWDYAFVTEFHTDDGAGNVTVTLDAPEMNVDALDGITVTPHRRLVVRNAVLYEDQFILHVDEPLKIMDGYKDIPYTISFFKPTRRDRSHGWHSIITPLVSTISAMERMYNRIERQVTMFTGLPIVIKSISNRPITLDPGMGKAVSLGPDDDIAFPAWPGNPPDVQKQMDFLRARAQQSGFSDVMFGSGSNPISGFALSQLGDQNRIRLAQPITHLERLWTWWARKAIDLTLEFARNAELRIYGQMKGREFAEQLPVEALDGYHVSCEIRPEFPNERVRNHAMSTQVRGLLSERTIMENYLNIQQPEDERKRKLMELAQTNPIGIQFGMMAALTEMAEEGNQVAVQVLQVMQQQIAAGGQDNGNAPNPEQPMGLAFPDGGTSPQEQGNPTPGRTLNEEMENMAGASPNMQGGVV